MNYYHVDVFSKECLAGNGLTIIFHEEEMETNHMQKIAQEFKQFETIFLKKIKEKHFRAKIFTVEEELDFAGHPILGAVSAIHEKLYSQEKNIAVQLQLNNKKLQSESRKRENYYQATMNQGVPEFLGTIEGDKIQPYLHALNLTFDNLHPTLPMEVVSTGLPYLIVPLVSGLDRAKINVNNFEELLGKCKAKFVYLVDIGNMEGRTWDNLGAVEDVATGSAAGPTGAYLYKWNISKETESILINQGRFVGRPSRIKVFLDEYTGEVKVAGDVKIIAKGNLL